MNIEIKGILTDTKEKSDLKKARGKVHGPCILCSNNGQIVCFVARELYGAYITLLH